MQHELLARDLKHIWHPCSQMKDYDVLKPIEIESASGSYFKLKNGQEVIDAISSWWCKSLGHGHPRLVSALQRQLKKFEHVILANTTNDTIVALSEKLANLTQTLDKVFYASDGSSAVEIAMKMSLHSRKIVNDEKRKLFFSLENSYHGETVGAMSVSDLKLYAEPYRPLLFDAKFLSPLPYLNHLSDPLWISCEHEWSILQAQLEPWSDCITAIIVEPIVQGSAGMKMYSQDFLKRLRQFTQAKNIHLIADELMTGMGRTGKMLACEHAGIEPDFLCLGKGLTGGFLPLSAVLTRTDIYQLFYDDYENGKSFLHSHTFSGNALAASVALEMLTIFEEENILEHVKEVEALMYHYMETLAKETKKLERVRSIGAIAAADLVSEPGRRSGFEVFRAAVDRGALLRPIGNTLYWLPPLNVSFKTIHELYLITRDAIMAVSPP